MGREKQFALPPFLLYAKHLSANLANYWNTLTKCRLVLVNGPYRTRTVGDETNLTVATTQIPQLESCSSVADNDQSLPSLRVAILRCRVIRLT